MRKVLFLAIFGGCLVVASTPVLSAPLAFEPVRASGNAPLPAKSQPAPFVIRDARGTQVSIPLVDASAQRKFVGPLAKVDPKLNPALARAATIAQERAYAHSKSRCWRYVKEALLAAGAVDSYPKTALAKEAGNELVQSYGFKKLAMSDPYAAPIGAVLVYGGKGAGHVEIRNKTGFVSDFRAPTPSKRKLIGVYAKV